MESFHVEFQTHLALILVENRSLEEALSVIFNESLPSTSQTTFGNSREQATQANVSIVGSQPRESESDLGADRMYKMLFVVNGSLKMSSGKMCAQVAHAAVNLYSKLIDQRSLGLNFWMMFGQTKIVVRGDSAEELIKIQNKAYETKSIVTTIIQDAGKTEIRTSSITCLGLFGTNSQLDPITRHLKLMNDCLRCSDNDITSNENSRQRQTKQKAKGQQTNNIEEKNQTEDATTSLSNIADTQLTNIDNNGHINQTEAEICETK
ncbi:unnamed protein product [Didymodactylos carnosus]|uniref:peptidyl-tRNA hydrolase n=1 Tax=Didymodactylos carnosus TaxID=1234261 RepID=A0A813XMA2_9BILA|nr:unnamed protein product [Didymodactylos carnosus]CAF1002538.1 unnamed protein product [Didymodactylos carnosus]CAF3656410.1 unnamed protein product [Didymodactylos carnosus]CAF3771883.1 unnamed protein product [Didymodactylos carnosus]